MSVLLLKIEEISSLNLDEMASLIAKYKSFNQPRPDLSGYSPKQIEAMNKAKRKTTGNTEVLGFSYDCDMAEIDFIGFDYVVTLHNQYKKFGHLPFSGTMAEQPNKIMEIFNVISAIQHDEQLKEHKKQEMQNKLHKKRK